VKDFQLDLLPLTVEERIGAASAGPTLFFFVREAAQILTLTEAQVRWAIRWYRLDSLLVGNQYRIPRSALARFWRCRRAITRQRIGYDLCIKRQELLAPDPKPPIRSVLARDVFGSDDRPEAQEPDMMDWYDLWELPFPYEATAADWGRLLRSPTACIVQDAGATAQDVLRWPEIYDWMISREMVNLPVGVEDDGAQSRPRMSDPVPPSWQMMFEEFM
jgi:hypothetical protein